MGRRRRRPVGVRSRREVRGGGRRPRAANETPAARRSASSMRTQEPGLPLARTRHALRSQQCEPPHECTRATRTILDRSDARTQTSHYSTLESYCIALNRDTSTDTPRAQSARILVTKQPRNNRLTHMHGCTRHGTATSGAVKIPQPATHGHAHPSPQRPAHGRPTRVGPSMLRHTGVAPPGRRPQRAERQACGLRRTESQATAYSAGPGPGSV